MISSNSGRPESNPQEIYADFTRRRASGEPVDFAELCGRYPQWADLLEEMHNQPETVAASSHQNLQTATTSPIKDANVDSARDRKRYGILERLAQGGMGVIYKVWDRLLNRDLAMKVIRERKRGSAAPSDGSGVSAESVIRFKREAEITARLDHPGVVPIHDLGTDDDGRLYFTMRLVKGRRLDEVFDLSRKRSEGWSQTRALGVIVKICETLAFAHSKGVIHRDLKPANVMVGPFGETYVMDWGLAKLIGGRATIEMSTVAWGDVDVSEINQFGFDDDAIETYAGAVMGTASYMPPEQAAGKIDQLSERTDIYSVGAILYELLTGQRPYTTPEKSASKQDVLLAVANGPPPSMASFGVRVPVELEAICEKAMSRNQEDRYPTMLAMADDLRAYLENRVVHAYQSGAIAEFWKWVARNRSTAISAAIGLAVTFCSLLVIVQLQSQANSILETSKTRIENEKKQKEKALEQKTEALDIANAERRRAEGMHLARASADICDRNPSLALQLAYESAKLLPGKAANRAMLAALPLHHERKVFYGHTGSIWMADVNHDSTLAASASDDHTAIVWDIPTGTPVSWLIGHRDLVCSVRFSHSGKLVATTSYDKTAALWNSRTGERIHVLSGHDSIVWKLAFSPDDRLVATASLDGTARLWDVESGKPLGIFVGHSAEVYEVSFSPDGSSLLTGSSDKTARVWNVSTFSVRAVLPDHSGGVRVARFSPDGQTVLTTAASYFINSDSNPKSKSQPSTDQIARVWDAHTGKLKESLRHDALVQAAAFIPGSDRIVTGSADGTVRIWNGSDIERKFTDCSDSISSIAASTDGKLIAAADQIGKVHVWDTTTGWNICRLQGHAQAISTTAFLSAQTLLTASKDRTLRTWNVLAPGEIPPIQAGDLKNTYVAVSPTGNRLAVRSPTSNLVGLYSYPDGTPISALKHDQRVFSVQFSPDGEFLGTISQGGVAQVYSAKDGSLDMTCKATGRAGSIVFGADQLLVVISSSEGLVTTWKLGTRRLQHPFTFPNAQVLTASPDGRHLFVWQGSPHEPELWNLTLGTRTAPLSNVVNGANDFAFSLFSKDGRYLLTSSLIDQDPKLWKTETGELIEELDFRGNSDPITPRFSIDGDIVAVGSSSRPAHVFDTRDGHLLQVLSKDDPTTTQLFAGPNGRRIIVSCESKRSRLWNGQTGELISLLGDQDDAVDEAQFIRNGNIIVTMNKSRDIICLWNAENGEQISLLESGIHRFSHLGSGADSDWITTGFDDGSTRIWPVNPIETVRNLGLRPLTPDERERYIIVPDEERDNYRMAWYEHQASQMLALTAKLKSETIEHAQAVQSVAQQVMQQFIEGFTSARQKENLPAALRRVADELLKKGDPAAPTAAVLAKALANHGESSLATRLARSALDHPQLNDSTLWTLWVSLELGSMHRSPREVLDTFPKSPSSTSKDVRWLLECLEKGEPVRIRAGGGDLSAADGTVWRGDCFYGGGKVFGETFGNPQQAIVEILKTDNDALYQTERWFDRNQTQAERSYQIPLAPGNYQVVLHFAEIYFQPPQNRIITVRAEQKPVIINYDLSKIGFATADHQHFTVQVSDGMLDLEFEGVKENPKISAIEIFHLEK